MPFTFSDHALLTSDMFEALSGLNPDDLSASDKTVVELQVNASSRQILNHIGREIKQGTYVEVWDGQDSDMVIPKEYPLTSVVSMKFSVSGSFDNALQIPQDQYSIDPLGIAVYLRSGVVTPRERGSVRLEYVAGFSTIPDDLQYACFLQWSYLSNAGNGSGMIGLESISKMQESQRKDQSLKRGGLISEVSGMIEQYKRLDAPTSVMFARVS